MDLVGWGRLGLPGRQPGCRLPSCGAKNDRYLQIILNYYNINKCRFEAEKLPFRKLIQA